MRPIWLPSTNSRLTPGAAPANSRAEKDRQVNQDDRAANAVTGEWRSTIVCEGDRVKRVGESANRNEGEGIQQRRPPPVGMVSR